MTYEAFFDMKSQSKVSEEPMHSFVIVIQILVLIMAFSVILFLAIKKPFRGQHLFLLMSAAVAIQSFGYYLELTSTSLSAVLMAIKTQYFGSCFVNLLFILFFKEYCNLKKNKKLLTFLFIFNLFILIFVCTCEYHTLYYSSMEFVHTGLFPHVVLGRGPIYTLFKAQVLIMNVYVLYLVIHHYFSLSKPIRKYERNFIVACLFPTITCPLYITGLFKEYDPSSASFVLSGFLVLISIYRRELFDIIHTARDHVIDSMEEALIVSDGLYSLLDYNPSAKKLFPELLTSKHNYRLQEISPFLYDLLSEKEAPDFIRNDRYYHTQITKIYNQNTLVGYSAWVFDITESKKNIEKQIQLREQAESANQAKSIFLANMSHEIRTPLNAILGITDILLNRNLDYSVRNDIVHIKSAGNTLLSLINDIIDLSRIESGKMNFVVEEYKLSTLLQDVIHLISVKLSEKPIILQVDVDPKLPKYLYGDELRLRQILINVLNNAVKYTDQGRIGLKVYSQSSSKENQKDIILIFSVEDTGRGISEQDQQRIFESFEQAEQSHSRHVEGSGLGLAICQKMLNLIGGNISVVSKLHQGSTFTIQLPQRVSTHLEPEIPTNQLSQTDKLPISSATLPVQSKTFATQTNPFSKPSNQREFSILVVDDNLLNLQVAKGLIELFGIAVTSVSSGIDALAALETMEYDLIFLDYMMPQMNGIQTLQAIRALHNSYCKTVPIIALTANAIAGSHEMFLSANFNDYLSKPIKLKHLGELLSKWLAYDFSLNHLVNEDYPDNKVYDFQFFSETYQLNWKQGFEYCSSSWNCYFDTLSLFSVETLKQSKELKDALEERDYSRYALLIHTIKSSLKTIGAEQLSIMAQQLEEAIKDYRTSFLENNHPYFFRKLKVLCHSIQEFLSADNYD